MLIFLLITFTLTVIVIINWMKMLSDRKMTNIPGPTPLPLVGNAIRFWGEPVRK